MEKILWSKKKRNGALLLGIGLLAGGVLGIVLTGRPVMEQKEQIVYTYGISAECDYRVQVTETLLYDSPWLESGQAYPGGLTQAIELTFLTGFFGSTPVDVTGRYEVKAMIKGVYNGTLGKTILYQDEFVLKQGKLIEQGVTRGETKTVVQIEPQKMREFVLEAEKILGTSANSEITVELTGSYLFDTPDGQREEMFTYQQPLPLIKGSEIYEIANQEKLIQEKTITETITSPVTASRKSVPPLVLMSAAGMLLAGFAGLGTRLPLAEETLAIASSVILRKYSSRMVALKQPPQLQQKKKIYVVNMDQLMLLSEEIQRPIFYELDKDEKVVNERFYLFDQEFFYIYQIGYP